MNKVKYKILKKNRTNFRILIEEKTVADLIIDTNTDLFVVGDIKETYLVKQRAFKGKPQKIARYKFSDDAPECKISLEFSQERYRVEVTTDFENKGVFKNCKFRWDSRRKIWFTNNTDHISKCLRELRSKNKTYQMNNEFMNKVNIYKQVEKSKEDFDFSQIDDSDLPMPISEIITVLTDIENKSIELRGFYWKDSRFQYQNECWITNTIDFEYLKKVCYFYNCTNAEELKWRV